MNKFSFSTAHNVHEAIDTIAHDSAAMFIAGGTNLLDLMKENLVHPKHLVDINHLGLNTIEKIPGGGLHIGALVTNAETAYHPDVELQYPLLSKSILAGASAQLRNMATNGGNLMQRTRCFYFYDLATPCNKRNPGSGCSAIKGYNRNHAILGASEHCIATFPSDMCVALAALDAIVCVSGMNGERKIPFDAFHRLPGDTPDKDNNLLPGEIITGIDLGVKGFPQYYKYLKLRDRASYAFALVSIAAAFEIDGGEIKEARLALGGVAHKPWRNKTAEAFLINKVPGEENFKKAAEIILEEAKGYGNNNFKIKLAKQAILRSCLQALNKET